MKTTRTLSSYVLLVGVMGLSIVGGVVAYQIYSASVKSQATPEQVTATKPIDGAINKTTVDSLRGRTVYNNNEMDSLVFAPPTPEATESSEIQTPLITPAPILSIAPEAPESTTAANLQ